MTEPQRIIPTARHEHSDIGEGFAWRAVALMLGVLTLCSLIVMWLYPQSLKDVTLGSSLPIYPAPRLQTNPPSEMRAFRAQQLQQLNGAGWVDRTNGVMHIPIEEAMRRVAQDGIPGWPTAATAAPASSGTAQSPPETAARDRP